MLRNRALLSLFIILSIAISLAGCGAEEPTPTVVPATNTPVATDTPIATDIPVVVITPQPTPTLALIITPEPAETDDEATAEQVLPDGDLLFNIPADVLTSFRMRGELVIVTTFAEGAGEEERLSLQGARVATDGPFGFDQFLEMEVVSAGEEGSESVAVYQVGNVVATLFDGEWRAANRNGAGISMQENPFNQPLAELAVSLATAEEVSVETIDGVEAVHYRIEEPQTFIQVANLQMVEGQAVESSQMDVWVATEARYIMRYEIMAQVTDALDFDAAGNQVWVDQNVHWTFEIYDIDADFSVTLPEEAPEPAAFEVPGFREGEFPLPEGAQVRTNLFGETEISINLAEDEVVRFYLEVLGRLGWSIQGDFGLYEAQKDNLRFNLVTAANDQGETVVRVRTE